MNYRSLLAATASLICSLSVTSFAQAPATSATTSVEPAFHAGDFDLLLGAGFGAFLYPHIEPSVDVGIIPIDDDFSISIGGGADLGYCVLCGVVSLATNADIKSYYVFPHGRINVHLGTLGGLLSSSVTSSTTLDPYLGLMGGPAFYTFSLADDSGEGLRTSASSTSVIFGPTAGLRAGFGDNRWLLFGEYRYNLEVGFDTVTIEDSNGTIYSAGDGYSRAGHDLVLGGGVRF